MDGWYLRSTGRGSQVYDIRYARARGDHVRITRGRHAGKLGTVESRVAPRPPNRLEPGYRVHRDDGAFAIVQRDEVEAARN